MKRTDYRHSLPWNCAFFLEWSLTRDDFEGTRDERIARAITFADDACRALEDSRGIALSMPVEELLEREDVPRVVTSVTGYPARWWTREDSLPYDGSENTLLMYGVPTREQTKVLEDLEPRRSSLHAAAGGSIVVVFRRQPPA
jgi:hypothetical protein